MNHFQRILVATDTRLEAHPIVDEAAELARHAGATLKIVDVVRAKMYLSPFFAPLFILSGTSG